MPCAFKKVAYMFWQRFDSSLQEFFIIIIIIRIMCCTLDFMLNFCDSFQMSMLPSDMASTEAPSDRPLFKNLRWWTDLNRRSSPCGQIELWQLHLNVSKIIYKIFWLFIFVTILSAFKFFKKMYRMSLKSKCFLSWTGRDGNTKVRKFKLHADHEKVHFLVTKCKLQQK